jgi:hypothetical protein
MFDVVGSGGDGRGDYKIDVEGASTITRRVVFEDCESFRMASESRTAGKMTMRPPLALPRMRPWPKDRRSIVIINQTSHADP